MPGLGIRLSTYKWRCNSQHTSDDQTPTPCVRVTLIKTKRKGLCVKSGRSSALKPGKLNLATKCSDAGTGDLGVLTTHEASPMEMTTVRNTHLATAFSDLEPLSGPRVFGHARWRKDWVEVSSEPGVPPSETWSTHLAMPAQPTPGGCRRKYRKK